VKVILKAPTSNIQAPEKFQAPSFKKDSERCLMFEVWCFSGAWMLELGCFPLLS
jgi:hypothetical protein